MVVAAVEVVMVVVVRVQTNTCIPLTSLVVETSGTNEDFSPIAMFP
jgi:hypothetical protein